MELVERLLDYSMPLVEELLKKNGEFFPLASAIGKEDNIIPLAVYNGDDKPKSIDLIAELKLVLKNGAKNGEYKAITLFYDVRVIDPHSKENTDAIAVFGESRIDQNAYTFFFPYKLSSNNQLSFSLSWKSSADREIFVH